MSDLTAAMRELAERMTPGPWYFDGDWGRIPTVLAADGTSIATCEKAGHPNRHDRTAAQEANARVIALADLVPRLVMALENVMNQAHFWAHKENNVIVHVSEKDAADYDDATALLTEIAKRLEQT